MIKVRSAAASDADACAAVLADAFLDDPGAIVFEPDRARRRIILPPFFRTFVMAAIAEAADLVVPVQEVTGVASWFGPERHAPSEAAMDAAGFAQVIDLFGPEAAGRMGKMVAEIDAQHASLIQVPHLRLEFFGVDPDAQGQGVGSALITHGHAHADARGLPCFLETFTKRNVAYYERRGYQVIGTYLVGDEVPVYAMRRDPSGSDDPRSA